MLGSEMPSPVVVNREEGSDKEETTVNCYIKETIQSPNAFEVKPLTSSKPGVSLACIICCLISQASCKLRASPDLSQILFR